MSVRGHHHEPRLDIEPSCSPPQQGQQEQGHQEGRYDIDSYAALEAPVAFDVGADCHASILDKDVQSVELGFGAAAEGPDALEAAEIELPGLHDALSRRGRFDISPGGFAPVEVATGQDDSASTETAEVTRGFPAETHISAGHDYCFLMILGLRVGQGAQLSGEEVRWVPRRSVKKGGLKKENMLVSHVQAFVALEALESRGLDRDLFLVHAEVVRIRQPRQCMPGGRRRVGHLLWRKVVISGEDY